MPITKFVLGLIGLMIGSHLDFRKLRNSGKRIIWITLVDILLVAPLVYTGLRFVAGMSIEISVFVSIIATATAPGSILHIIRETRAQGILTKTILAVVALNNALVILIFYTASSIFISHSGSGEFNVFHTVLSPFMYLIESLLAGGLVGLALMFISEKYKRIHISFPAMVLLGVVLTAGISESLHFSGLLSGLVMGMMITNFSKHKDQFFSAFRDLEGVIFALFFVLAGTHFDFGAMKIAGIAGATLIVFRFLGKFIAPTIGAHLADTTRTVAKGIGISLYPLAGLAIGLTLFIESIPQFRQFSSTITAIVLTAVVVFELLGPIFTKHALQKAGEINKNRLRLLDFLQEEFIKIGVKNTDKWKTLEELTDFLYRSHHMKHLNLQKLKKGVIEREREVSTGIGEAIAIPHVIVEGGPKIMGIIATCKQGIEFDALDGKPVKIIILVATPKEHYDMHLKVMATVAKIFGHNTFIREMIINAKTPEEVFEILQHEEVDELNPYFED
ncbi:MAG: PTS sugar transporter subunit IIA [Candidatus Cloacimonetes bacterium]|nr:PTS sugar transporter subunit IIA [Candidatus Cloacimonadota bacterium]